MKYTIRDGVWETNSSSVHSMVVKNTGLRNCRLKPRADGYIHVPLHYYGLEEKYYWTQKEKLAYLLTCVAYMASCGNGTADYDRYYDDYHYQYVNDAVRHYLEEHDKRYDVLGVKVDKLEDAELDHQSIPEFGEFPIAVSIWNEESIQNFIFNSYVGLKTECD